MPPLEVTGRIEVMTPPAVPVLVSVKSVDSGVETASENVTV